MHRVDSSTDHGGFTDHVFAARSVLGYAIVPRIRDLPSQRLYVFERGRPEASARWSVAR